MGTVVTDVELIILLDCFHPLLLLSPFHLSLLIVTQIRDEMQ